ncbi:MFS transporter [Micromonospora sp. NPDC005173]|uniref:MFS transporter n=1 Tax=Micromonospora sp. NPDC005173 TaxID=3157165 RepID=UPI0033B4BF23
MSPLPPSGRLRTLSLATLANSVGAGLWLTGAALYLTRVVGLSAVQVGAGLSVAGLVGLTASVPLGGLADRRDPRTLRAVLQVLQAAVAAAYLLVGSFPMFLVVAVLELLLTSGNLAVRAALVAAVAGPQGRVHAFATLRAVANLGIALGAGLAGFALAADTHLAYQILVAGNAASYLVSAALLLRLPAFPPPPHPATAAALRRGRPLHNGRFLAVSGASAVLALHQTVLTLVVPLWAVTLVAAPPPVVSAVLLTNTLLTVLLAVRLSRGADAAAPAARKMRRAGLVLAAAMLLYAATATLPTASAVTLLLVATVVYTVGDLWHSTAGAGLAYDLAPPDAVGAYQGADGMLAGLARAVAPALLTLVVLDGGVPGWLAVGGLFAVVGLAIPALTRWALATRPGCSSMVGVTDQQSIITIRPGGPDDAATVLRLLDGATAWLAARGRTGQWGTEPASTDPRRIAQADGWASGGGLHLAMRDDRPVGALVVGAASDDVPPATEPELYVRLLVTDREHAGLGIGARLLEYAAELARSRGLGLLRVDCYGGDDRALVRFYERCSFTTTDSFTVARPGRDPWPGQFLVRRLG